MYEYLGEGGILPCMQVTFKKGKKKIIKLRLLWVRFRALQLQIFSNGSRSRLKYALNLSSVFQLSPQNQIHAISHPLFLRFQNLHAQTDNWF